MKTTFFLAFAICLIALTSCKKVEFNRYTGTYDVRHYTHNWESGATGEHIIADKSIDVVRNSDFVDVVDRLVHIDSLEKDTEFKSGTENNFFTLKFIDDSIYYYVYKADENGGSINSYIGKKDD